MLKYRYAKKIPKITEDFDSKYFQVRQRIDNKDYKLDNKNIEFLRRKVGVTKHIVENAEKILTALKEKLPKGEAQIKAVYLKLTMSPAVKIGEAVKVGEVG